MFYDTCTCTSVNDYVSMYMYIYMYMYMYMYIVYNNVMMLTFGGSVVILMPDCNIEIGKSG